MSTSQQYVAIARIVRPQGRRGEVLADILTDFPEKFSERRRLWISVESGSGVREYSLVEHWFHKGRIVLKFSGVDSISDAQKLNGMLVQIPAESRAKLDPNAFYVNDLVGSTILNITGASPASIGKIEDVQQGSGAAPILIVRKGDREYEIPLAQEYIVGFDSGTKTLRMKLPSGLLEINAPLSKDEKQRGQADEWRRRLQ